MKKHSTKMISICLLIIYLSYGCDCDPSLNVNFDYPNINDEIYEQPLEMMAPAQTPQGKDQMDKTTQEIPSKQSEQSWDPYDFSKFDAYLNNHIDGSEHNRIKRRAKRRRGNRRRNRPRQSTSRPDDVELSKNGNSSTSELSPDSRRQSDTVQQKGKRKNKNKEGNQFDMYDPPIKEYETGFIEMPKDLYQAHLRPGVIFRVHMSEAILKMQYRNYGEDKDESVIEADVEYLRLTRKVINDELTKFEDLTWLIGWFNNRSELIQEHMCNTRYFAVGIPPTIFTNSEEYMKRMCLFDNVYIDHIPYVVGEDGSLMASVAPPVLHCDAATCTSVPFIDSIMFDEKLSRTNVRTLTRCQASCRAHCRNDPDCLKRCSDRCLRSD